MSVISLDELPRHTPWVARLLGLEPVRQYQKTEAEVLREWERDRWGPLLERVRNCPGVRVEEAERLFQGSEGHARQVCVYDRGQFRGMSLDEAFDLHFHTLADSLRPFLEGSSALVELGAGFGSKLLRLIRLPGFDRLPVFAGEYAPSGPEMIETLARNDGRHVRAGQCDFFSCRHEVPDVPSGALVYTSMATVCIPQLPDEFPDFLASFQPRLVVHFEPVWEHHCGQSLYGMLCRRYAEVNDYNRNLRTVLKRAEERGRLQIVHEDRTLEGLNPLLPASVIAWKPAA